MSPGSLYASQYGGTLTFAVEAPSGCAWTASTNAAWAVVASGASGTGSGLITIQAPTNSGATQSALLNVVSQSVTQSITITQPANSCSYSLDKSPYLVAQGGGTVSATLTTATGCPWTLTNNYSSAVTRDIAFVGSGYGKLGNRSKERLGETWDL